ncbi:dehydrogenase, putative [Ixodes scapularis]|uniref:Dehydrogenase, putative n=1 Tax=Ixodes scapularis TaxID=6945 RepID=B7PR16_IXOSC|nr:dehydrogenase, putative [Ixodes scapularis]|eukprot:XP_002436208.1 dehydrogenase, putative [Ixodes scapularis]
MGPYETKEDISLLWMLFAALAKIVAVFATTAVCVRAYVVYSRGVCRSKATMEGKTVIITGGNGGIGKETAKELARRKARVIIACRNLQKAGRAAREIFEETQQSVIIKPLDLASLTSVRAFAEDIMRTEARLDVLINNAGVMRPDVKLTKDGYEECFQTNYLGHCLLTLLLLGLLKKSVPSRIVNLSSFLHHLGNVDNLQAKAKGTDFGPLSMFIYFHTKLAIIVFTRALASKLKGHGVTANSVHPGVVETDMGGCVTGIFSLMRLLTLKLYGKSVQEAAETSVHAAVDPALTSSTGKYFVDCREDWVNWKALDPKKTKEVFETTLRLVNFDAIDLDRILSS